MSLRPLKITDDAVVSYFIGAANHLEYYATISVGDFKLLTDLTGTLRDQMVLWVSCSQRIGITGCAIWLYLIKKTARSGKSRQIDEAPLLLAG